MPTLAFGHLKITRLYREGAKPLISLLIVEPGRPDIEVCANLDEAKLIADRLRDLVDSGPLDECFSVRINR